MLYKINEKIVLPLSIEANCLLFRLTSVAFRLLLRLQNFLPMAAEIQDGQLQLDGYQLSMQKILVNSEADDAPVLVFLHDSLGCTKLWREFPVRLATQTGLNALVYDRRGYGNSSPFGPAQRTKRYLEEEADLLPTLLKAAGIQKSILFGHSDGGSIALIAAAKYPNLVTAIVTEGAHIFVEDITLQGIRSAVAAYETTNLADKLAKYHGDKTEALFKAWTDTWLSAGFRDWNIEDIISQVTCPVLAIQGEDDEYGSIAQTDGIKANVGGKCMVEIIPQAKHTPHKEAFDQVMGLVFGFIFRATHA